MIEGRKIKIWIPVLTALLLAVLLSACGQSLKATDTEEPSAGQYRIYYSDTDNTGLVSRIYRPKSETFDGILRELLEQFRYAPDEQVISALPGGVSINGYTMGVDDLTIDFNASYLGLSNVQEVLARAGIVKTLVQLPGVRNVSVTVDSQPLTEPDGTVVGPMNEETFVETQGDEINSYRHADMKLYFADGSGQHLVEEDRSGRFSSNLILERVVVENVLKGPEESTLHAVCFSDVPINNVYLDDKICVVDLGSRLNDVNNLSVSPEVVLYAIVNSLMDSCEIEGVRILIDGKDDVRLRSQINLEQTFTRDDSLIADLSDTVQANTMIGVGAGKP